jgi:hypothetical protein
MPKENWQVNCSAEFVPFFVNQYTFIGLQGCGRELRGYGTGALQRSMLGPWDWTNVTGKRSPVSVLTPWDWTSVTGKRSPVSVFTPWDWANITGKAMCVSLLTPWDRANVTGKIQYFLVSLLTPWNWAFVAGKSYRVPVLTSRDWAQLQVRHVCISAHPLKLGYCRREGTFLYQCSPLEIWIMSQVRYFLVSVLIPWDMGNVTGKVLSCIGAHPLRYG